MAERAAPETAHDTVQDPARDTGVDTSEVRASALPFPSLGRRNRPTAAPSEPRLRTLIGDVLREERHDQERTLADVADAAAVSLPYLSEVERGTKEVSASSRL